MGRLHYLLRVFVLAVPINYIWEIAQAPLFVEMEASIGWHCFVASLGDGLLVILIYGTGALLRRDSAWFQQPVFRDYALILLLGAALAIVVEWVALHVLQRWSYTTGMPIVPIVNIGLTPLLQMLVLPPVILRIAAIWNRTSRHAA